MPSFPPDMFHNEFIRSRHEYDCVSVAGVYKMFWCKFTCPSPAFNLSFNLTKTSLFCLKKKGHQSSVNPPFLNCQPSCKPSFFLHFPSFSFIFLHFPSFFFIFRDTSQCKFHLSYKVQIHLSFTKNEAAPFGGRLGTFYTPLQMGPAMKPNIFTESAL